MSREFKRLAALLISSCFFLTLSTSTSWAAVNVSTYMSNGTSMCTTTPTLQSSVQIGQVWGITSDSAGNVYYVDRTRFIACKVRTDGYVVRIAGTGSAGMGGDNIQATTSALQDPFGIIVDSSGNVYIADGGAHSVRKIDTSGVITTIFNTAHTNAISGNGGLATSAATKQPIGLTFDNQGRIVFSDYGGCTIWRIENNGTATILNGGGVCSDAGYGGQASSGTISQPGGIAYDNSGNLYVTQWTHKISKISSTGILSYVVGNATSGGSATGDGGVGTSGTVYSPWGIATDGTGNVYWTERGSYLLRRLDASTGYLSTVAGISGTTGHTDGALGTATLGLGYALTVLANGDILLGEDDIRKITGSAVGIQFPSQVPTFTLSAKLTYRTISTITATTTTSGTVTFYQNDKPIPGCKSLIMANSAGGNLTCSYRPALHGSVKIHVVLTTGGQKKFSNPTYVAVGARSTSR